MQAVDDGIADLGPSAAAITQQENRDIPELRKVGAVDDRAAMPLGGHEACARQDREMGRQCVRRHFEQACEVAGRKAVGLVPNQRPERFQAGRLRQRGEREDGFFGFHISRLMELLAKRQSENPPGHVVGGVVISNILEIRLTARVEGRMLPGMKIDDAAARLEALGNRTRLQIYRALVRAGHSGMPVGRLQEKLKIPASTLSHHIKSLVAVGLVSQVRESTTLVCHANYDAMRGLVDFLAAECCADEAECRGAQSAA